MSGLWSLSPPPFVSPGCTPSPSPSLVSLLTPQPLAPLPFSFCNLATPNLESVSLSPCPAPTPRQPRTGGQNHTVRKVRLLPLCGLCSGPVATLCSVLLLCSCRQHLPPSLGVNPSHFLTERTEALTRNQLFPVLTNQCIYLSAPLNILLPISKQVRPLPAEVTSLKTPLPRLLSFYIFIFSQVCLFRGGGGRPCKHTQVFPN